MIVCITLIVLLLVKFGYWKVANNVLFLKGTNVGFNPEFKKYLWLFETSLKLWNTGPKMVVFTGGMEKREF